jgi:hypothetical protein
MSGRLRLVPFILTAASSSAAFAHHSFAMFDAAKFQSQKGVIKEVQWTNPHVWVLLAVQEDGKEVVYSYEAAAISVLKRVGWQRDSVKVGDKVTVVGHPYKDGRPGGSIDHLVLPDGQNLGTGDAIPGALVVPGVRQ